MSDNPYILYGMSASLYTGKVRAYLLHHDIPFVERGAGHPEFTGTIVPQIGRWIIPVLVTPDGTVLQDGTDIIDHLDQQGLGQYPMRSTNSLLNAVSHLFELFGGEGLLRPAMHYRWNFDRDNLAFLRTNFSEAFPPGLSVTQQAAMFDHSSGRMRKAGAMFGVSEATQATIERHYAEFLSLCESHLQDNYFLLGGQATLGDYGLMNGLFAHLARDPHPAKIMKREAPNVFAWTERMNRPGRQEHRLANAIAGLIETIPDTLKAMMRFVADDFLPEMIAHIDFTNSWLDQQNDISIEPIERVIGMAEFHWRGHDIRTGVMPYRIWMAQRLTDVYDAASETEQLKIRELFVETGLTSFLDHRVRRRVERKDNREVWGV